MTFLGLSIAELSAVVGILSVLSALVMKGFMVVREQITRPLIQAIDNLQVEIKQLDRTLTAEHLLLRQETKRLADRLDRYAKRWGNVVN